MDQTLPATPVVPLDTAALAGSVPPPDLSVINLFLQADTIVKIVMLMLLAASVWTWAIIFEKWFRLRRLRSQAKQFEESFWSGGSLETLFDRLEGKTPDPMSDATTIDTPLKRTPLYDVHAELSCHHTR